MEQEVKTENEQKKEYLRSYKDHVRRVNRISEEIKELREMMMSTKAINYDGMPHGSGGQGDLSGEVARIQGLIDELKRERGLRIMTYQDIARRIKKLRSRNEDDVLFYRYIKICPHRGVHDGAVPSAGLSGLHRAGRSGGGYAGLCIRLFPGV